MKSIAALSWQLQQRTEMKSDMLEENNEVTETIWFVNSQNSQ